MPPSCRQFLPSPVSERPETPPRSPSTASAPPGSRCLQDSRTPSLGKTLQGFVQEKSQQHVLGDF